MCICRCAKWLQSTLGNAYKVDCVRDVYHGIHIVTTMTALLLNPTVIFHMDTMSETSHAAGSQWSSPELQHSFLQSPMMK